MIFDLPLYNKILIILINFIGIWLGAVVGGRKLKNGLNRVFLANLFFMFLWVDLAYTARLVGLQYPDIALWLLKAAWFATPLLFGSLYFFVISYLDRMEEHPWLNKLIFSLSVAAGLVALSTDWIVKGMEFVGTDLSIIYGAGMFHFLGVVFVVMCATIYFLFRRYRNTSSIAIMAAKVKVKYLLIGIVIFYLANMIFNIIFPIFFEVVNLYWIGDYSSIILLILITYDITKHHLMNIKVITTEIFAGAMIVGSLMSMFESQARIDWIISLVSFTAVSIFAILLIRSVRREVRRRQQMEKLTQELKIATKQLKVANKKLQRLDQAKSEFLSIASHQLRTPLTVIKGYSSMMLEGSFGKMPAKIKANMDKIMISTERLISLVESLLNISRIEAGRIEFDIEPVELHKIVGEIVENFQQKAKAKKLKLEFYTPEGLPKALADPLKVKDVIVNLIDNSIKYTDKGTVSINMHEEGQSVVFSCLDTGMGIDPDDLPRLFQKFVRGKGMMKVHTEGTGLGLYYARMIVENMGGRIWAESIGKGKGSKFSFSLPMANKKKAKKLK